MTKIRENFSKIADTELGGLAVPGVLWLLGAPLSLLVVLWVFGVF